MGQFRHLGNPENPFIERMAGGWEFLLAGIGWLGGR